MIAANLRTATPGISAMKRSTDRILVTHVGSLVRPPAIRDVMWARERERGYDEAVFERTLKDEVAAVVRQQAATGVDVVSDGEFGKAGWIRYVAERLGGFVHREFREGDHEATPNHLIPEVAQFAEFYAAYHPIQYYDWLPPGQSKTPLKPDNTSARPKALVWDCVAPITYKGQAAIKRDIANFKSALAGVKTEGAFMPVAAPMSARGLWLNTYYTNDAEIVVALADALKEEYKAIVDAGFILQLDDAYMAHEYARLLGEMSPRDVHKYAESCVELTNHALSGIPEDKVRYHVCWGSWNVPHVQDVPLKTIVDLILKVHAEAYAIEAANPRHAHEFLVWKDVKLPDGKILIPGVISHATNVVEHPELVALRLKNFAQFVGRENVIAGTDCGFAQSYDIVRCHPSVQWAKLNALVEGARLASKELWGAAA
jgi:5-methyltetrahydropteroyltriglutamate--homocysteine methyltransferase